MGDDFIHKTSDRFKHRSEKIHAEEFGGITLFSVNPSEEVTLFRFKAPDSSPDAGWKIIFADLPGADLIRVIHGTTAIGEVDAKGSKEMRALMAANPSCNGYMPGIVTASKDIAGYAKAKIGK